VAIAVSVVLSAVGRDAYAAGCPPLDAPLELVTSLEIPRDIPVARDRDRAELTGSAEPAGGRFVLGVLDSRTLLRWVPEIGLRTNDAGTCAWVVGVRVTVGFERLVIRLANDYAPGSCAYDAVLEHERAHVDAAITVATEFRESVAERLRAAGLPDDRDPVWAADTDSAVAAIKARVRSAFDRMIDAYQAEFDAAQAEIDSPAAYAELTARCDDW